MRNNTYFCAYAILNDTLLAFSHGGLTRKFVDNAYKTKIDNYFDNDVNYKRLTDGLTKTGGYYRIVDDSTNTDVIIKCIEDYNRENKELLKKVVNDSLYSVTYSTPPTNWGWNFEKVRKGIHVKPSKGLVKLMAMTAGFDSCKHPTVGNCLFNENNVNTGEYSPIMPGIVDLRDEKMTLHCGDKKFVQFIGHVPQGFGASIDLFTKNGNDNSTYNINLDISNTGLTHDMVSNIDNLDKNFFYMAYSNNGKLTTHGKLHMNGSASSFKSITSDKSYVIEFDSEYDLLGADFKNHLIQKMISEEPKKPIFEHGKLVNNIFLYSIKSGYDYEAKTHTGGSRHKKRVTTRKNKLKNNKTKKNKRR
jgi:hypothetical protein